MKQVEPGAEPKPPRGHRGGGSRQTKPVYTKAGKNTRPTEREGGVAKISTYEASILSAILKEPAPTQKGGGYNQTKPVYPRARIIAPQKEGGGLLPKITFYEATMLKGSTR